LYLYFATTGNRIQFTWLKAYTCGAFACHVICNVNCKNFPQNSARLKLNQTRAQKANKRLFAQTRNFEYEREVVKAGRFFATEETNPSFIQRAFFWKIQCTRGGTAERGGEWFRDAAQIIPGGEFANNRRDAALSASRSECAQQQLSPSLLPESFARRIFIFIHNGGDI
jgi:hypothetical protein